MLVDLTVLSAADDNTLSMISRTFYFDREQDPAHNPNLRTQFLITSAWRDPEVLKAKLAFVKGLSDGEPQPVRRLDIVGHSIADRVTNKIIGLEMDDEVDPSISLSETGELDGRACFDAALAFCTPDVKLRLILCEGDELPGRLLEQIYAMLRRACPEAELWVTSAAAGFGSFDLGGFTNDGLLVQYTPTRAMPTARSGHPVQSPLQRDGYD